MYSAIAYEVAVPVAIPTMNRPGRLKACTSRMLAQMRHGALAP